MKNLKTTSMPKMEPMRMPQMISFDQTELPAIKDWKVGGKYTLRVKVEQVSMGKDVMDNEGEMRASFKVLAVEADGKDPGKAKGNPAKYPRYGE